MSAQTVNDFLVMIKTEYNNDFTLWFQENQEHLPKLLEQFNNVPMVWLPLSRAYDEWVVMNKHLDEVRELMDGNQTQTSVLPVV